RIDFVGFSIPPAPLRLRRRPEPPCSNGAAMLERTELRLGPWTPAADSGRWQRAVHDGGGQAIGVVRTRRRLFRWRRRLEIFETDDESLILSLVPAWFGAEWHVRDSEGNYVGTLLPDALLDPAGRRFAERIADGPERWRLR